jgi:hypothetical protein
MTAGNRLLRPSRAEIGRGEGVSPQPSVCSLEHPCRGVVMPCTDCGGLYPTTA